ncbi:Tn3 family transposase [Nonomuraea jabiensis]|uniref:TnpA family transposase n=1 Tax=Nonomuraea jabiensis TaxID=882448 RepID=A0A7W9LFA3_9ACTN|nr:Tn3 family transposase [Nonomuraea jabiensis]MBB5781692.1 TnpA family transposase [Nonomuraea jabiensis]
MNSDDVFGLVHLLGMQYRPALADIPILRVVVSIYTGEIRAYDVMRMIQRDGNPTPLGEAIAHYRRIFKTLHILTYAVEEPYRHDIKGIRNLQESRHALAGEIFHGRSTMISTSFVASLGPAAPTQPNNRIMIRYSRRTDTRTDLARTAA